MTRVTGKQIAPGVVPGDVLTWNGTSWAPAAPTGGVTPPADPGDNGKFPRAQAGDLTYITSIALTADLEVFTDVLQGVVPASGGGSVNFLRADGTWVAPPGGISPPIDPGDNGKYARAQAGDLTYVTATQVTADLNLFTNTLKGVVPASGGGTVNFLRADGTWVAPPGGVSPPSGGAGQIAYANGTDLSYATSVKIITDSAIAFGSTPATAGLLRVHNNSIVISGRDAANSTNLTLLAWSPSADDTLIVGSDTVPTTRLAATSAIRLFLGSAGGAEEYSFTNALADFKDNSLQFGTNPAASGLLRVPHASTVLAGRNQANSGDVTLITWGSGANNRLTLGSATVAETYLNVTTGGSYNLQINSATEYTFDSVALTMNGNNLLMGAGFAAFGTNPATTGNIRFPQSSQIYARNNANAADLPLLRMGAITDTINIGGGTEGIAGINLDTTSGLIKLRVANVDEYSFSSTIADFKNNSASFGTTPAASGLIRVPHGSTVVASRNQAGTADVQGLSIGTFFGGDNAVKLGGTNANVVVLDVATGGTHGLLSFQFDGSQVAVMSPTFLNLASLYLDFGSGTSTGTIRLPYGSTVIGRNQVGTADIQGLSIGTYFGANDVVKLGGTNANVIAIDVATGGSHGLLSFQFDGSQVAVMSPTFLNLASLYLDFGSSSSTGLIRVPHASTVLTGRNFADSADASLISWGITANNRLTIGDTNAAETYFNIATGGSYVFQINGATEYTFDASNLNLNGNGLAGLTSIGFQGTIATTGLIRVAHGVSVIAGRNFGNTADSILLAWGTGANNRITIGDTNAAELQTLITSGGVVNIGFGASLTEYSFTTNDFTIAAGNTIKHGTVIATTGSFRVTTGWSLFNRNNANTGDLQMINSVAATDRLEVGDQANSETRILSATLLSVYIGASLEYSFNASTLAMNGNSMTNVLFVSSTGTVAGTGFMRTSSAATIAVARNAANTGDITVLSTDASDHIVIGAGAAATATFINAATAGNHNLQINSATEYTFDATQLTWNGNNSVGAGFYSTTGTVAGTGQYRGVNNTTLVSARNAGNTADVAALTVDASNVVVLGGAGTPNASRVYANATTNFTAAINGTDEYVFSGTSADFKLNALTNVESVNIFPQAAGPGAGGAPQAISIATQSYTGLAGNIRVMTITSTGTFSQVAGTYSTASVMRIRQPNIAGDTATATFTGVTSTLAIQGPPTQGTNASLANSVSLHLEQSDASMAVGATPATTGTFRFSNAQTVFTRNAANTQNQRVLEMADNLSVGDGGANGNAQLYLDVKPSGSHVIRIGNTTNVLIDSAKVDFKDHYLVLSTAPAASGLLRFGTNPGTVLACVNYDSTGDQTILTLAGGAGFTDLRLGDGGAKGTNTHYYQCKAQHVFVLGAVSEYTFDATQLTLNANNVVGAGFYSGSGTVAGTGLLRAANGVTIIGASQSGGGGDIPVLATSVNDIIIGSSTAANTGITIYGGGDFAFPGILLSVGTTVPTNVYLNRLDGLVARNVGLKIGAGNSAPIVQTNSGIGLSHGMYILGRNFADTGDIALMQWGVGTNNQLRLGVDNAANIGVLIAAAGGSIGFYAATPVTKPNVSGSRGGNAALASLMTALANLGLVSNSTSA